jgi:O-antigen/teichoic acid export membrane protein
MVGIYAAAYTVGRQPIDALSNAIVQGSYPELIARFDVRGAEVAAAFVSEIIVLILSVTTPIAVTIALLAKPIAETLFPPAYHTASAEVLPWLVWGALALSLKSYALDNVLLVSRRNWILLGTHLLAATATTGAMFILVPRFGAPGAAMALLVGCAIGCISSYLAGSAVMRITISRQDCLRLSAAAFITWICGTVVMAFSRHTPVVLFVTQGLVTIVMCSLPWINGTHIRATTQSETVTS